MYLWQILSSWNWRDIFGGEKEDGVRLSQIKIYRSSSGKTVFEIWLELCRAYMFLWWSAQGHTGMFTPWEVDMWVGGGGTDMQGAKRSLWRLQCSLNFVFYSCPYFPFIVENASIFTSIVFQELTTYRLLRQIN